MIRRAVLEHLAERPPPLRERPRLVQTPEGLARLDADRDGDVVWVSAERAAPLGPLAPENRPPIGLVMALRGGRRGRTFALTSAGETVEGSPGLVPAEEELDVVGALALPLGEAAELLAVGSPAPEWVPRLRVYELLSENEQEFLASAGARDLVAASRGRPVEITERMLRGVANILTTFLGPRNRAVLIDGVAGSGKTTLIDVLCRRLTALEVPGRLQGVSVASLGIEPFMPSHSSEEELNKAALRARLAAHDRIVWVVDEASRLVDRHASTAALDNLLLFIDQGARVVLASDCSSLLKKREAFVRRVSPLYLAPASLEEALVIVSRVAEHQAGLARVELPPETISAAVGLSRALPFAQPHAGIDLAARSIARAERMGTTLVGPAEVKETLAEMLAQGDRPPPPLRSEDAFVARMRELGFRGHAGFLEAFAELLIGAIEDRIRPSDEGGVFFRTLVLGPPAVGKSLLFRCVTSVLVSSSRKSLTLRGSQFAQPHAVQTLRGSPLSYVGLEQGSQLGDFVKRAPDGVLIAEEPELAHPALLDLLLEVLDGTFTTGDGQEISTRGLTVLVGSNQGCVSPAITLGFSLDSIDERRKESILRSLHEIDPRLLSRFEEEAVFLLPPLESAALRNIVRLTADRFGQSKDVRVRLTDDVVEAVLEEARPDIGRSGARAVIGVYKRRVETRMRQLVRRQRPAALLVRMEEGEMVLAPVEEDEPGGGA